MSNFKGIYKGPPHYWHSYALNPREKYYYGYYGYYGPWVDKSLYEPINDTVETLKTTECKCNGGCNCNLNKWVDTTQGMWMLLILVAVLIVIMNKN